MRELAKFKLENLCKRERERAAGGARIRAPPPRAKFTSHPLPLPGCAATTAVDQQLLYGGPSFCLPGRALYSTRSKQTAGFDGLPLLNPSFMAPAPARPEFADRAGVLIANRRRGLGREFW